MFSDTLKSILDELNECVLTRDEIMKQAIKERLDTSLYTYKKEVTDSKNYLSNRTSRKALYQIVG